MRLYQTFDFPRNQKSWKHFGHILTDDLESREGASPMWLTYLREEVGQIAGFLESEEENC
jgi:hypothetical protein